MITAHRSRSNDSCVYRRRLHGTSRKTTPSRMICSRKSSCRSVSWMERRSCMAVTNHQVKCMLDRCQNARVEGIPHQGQINVRSRLEITLGSRSVEDRLSTSGNDAKTLQILSIADADSPHFMIRRNPLRTPGLYSVTVSPTVCISIAGRSAAWQRVSFGS